MNIYLFVQVILKFVHAKKLWTPQSDVSNTFTNCLVTSLLFVKPN